MVICLKGEWDIYDFGQVPSSRNLMPVHVGSESLQYPVVGIHHKLNVYSKF